MDIHELNRLLREGYSGRELTSLYTGRVDSLLKSIFSSADQHSSLCLMAVGGYGRAELAPHSDIDIMLFARDRSPAERAKEFLYKLWDTNRVIGHSFRTPEDCIIEAKKDVKTRTSLLEHRYIAGDTALYQYFMDNVYPEIAFREQRKFTIEKLREVERRHRKISDSVFMLEPHIKEGRGGLRDIHTLVWLASVRLRMRHFDQLSQILNADDFYKLARAYDYLLKVRFCLHLLSGRRNDVLSFEFHNPVARMLSFKGSRRFFASERFMRYFYLKTSVINTIASGALDLFSSPLRGAEEERGMHFSYARKKITEDFFLSKNRIVTNCDGFKDSPEKMLEAFSVFSKTGKQFSPRLKETIRKNLFRIGRTTRNSSRAIESFLSIIRGDRVYETLREMHTSGVLGRFIPEFGALSFLVVYEPYHRYTVDEHTLNAIKKVEGLRTTRYKNLEHLSGVFERLKKKEALILALLLHDIGKRGIAKSYRYGSTGGHHEEAGYREVKGIIERCNLALEVRTLVEFLVRNHLLMSSVALKMDTEDPEVIAQFADEVGDRDTLDALYLLTYADTASVSNDFWTEWKAYLLRDLYDTTARHLDGFMIGGLEAQGRVLEKLSLSNAEKNGIRHFLSSMPERYSISTTPEGILADYRLSRTVEEKGFGLRVKEDPGGTAEISVGAWDRPGIFSDIVGVLSSLKMNIYRARVYTGKNGMIIDKIHISNWEELVWEGLVQDLEERLKTTVGTHDMHDGYACVNRKRGESPPLYAASAESFGRYEPFVELDNETSTSCSILEFFAPDRIGLLYDATRLLFEKGADIISARINTESGLAHDVFSIQHEGRKIEGAGATDILLSLWERLT